ncbi:hypothetical protein V8C42DRAFT_336009 [Trichoderma barbatum]
MVNVAVAGGLGNIGKTLVEVIQTNPRHRVIVLSRHIPEARKPDTHLFAVDYSNVENLAKILRDNRIDILISALDVSNDGSGASEQNLVRAADEADSVKRFVASSWGSSFRSTEKEKDDRRVTSARSSTIDLLRMRGLEWTQFHCGVLLDYFGLPFLRSNMRPITLHVDIENKEAAIPGSGDDIISWTYTFDLARFVEATLELQEWSTEFFCHSDTCSFNEVIELAENVRGAKFKVAYDDIETLQKGRMTELSSHNKSLIYWPKDVLRGFLSQAGLYVIEGMLHMPEDKLLNQQFPNIKTMTVQESLEVWRGK